MKKHAHIMSLLLLLANTTVSASEARHTRSCLQLLKTTIIGLLVLSDPLSAATTPIAHPQKCFQVSIAPSCQTGYGFTAQALVTRLPYLPDAYGNHNTDKNKAYIAGAFSKYNNCDSPLNVTIKNSECSHACTQDDKGVISCQGKFYSSIDAMAHGADATAYTIQQK